MSLTTHSELGILFQLYHRQEPSRHHRMMEDKAVWHLYDRRAGKEACDVQDSANLSCHRTREVVRVPGSGMVVFHLVRVREEAFRGKDAVHGVDLFCRLFRMEVSDGLGSESLCPNRKEASGDQGNESLVGRHVPVGDGRGGMVVFHQGGAHEEVFGDRGNEIHFCHPFRTVVFDGQGGVDLSCHPTPGNVDLYGHLAGTVSASVTKISSAVGTLVL